MLIVTEATSSDELTSCEVMLFDPQSKGNSAPCQQIQQLMQKLDKSFDSFTTVESQLWKEVRE